MMIDSSCKDFVEVLATKEPVPGGGGAAALCGAIGTALGNMVGSLTVGKKKYAAVEEEVLQIKSSCDQLQQDLLILVEEDAKAFKPLSAAYGLPSNTEEEKQLKEQTLEVCSKDAAMVPLRIMEKCCEALKQTERLATIGSRLAISDAGCSAAILKGALQAASLNIFINTKGMKDRAFAEELNEQAENMLASYGAKADEVFQNVKNSLK